MVFSPKGPKFVFCPEPVAFVASKEVGLPAGAELDAVRELQVVVKEELDHHVEVVESYCAHWTIRDNMRVGFAADLAGPQPFQVCMCWDFEEPWIRSG